MRTPWQNRTGLAKVIAIVATLGILSFGLCTAGVLTGLPETAARWAQPLQWFPVACGITATVSLPVLLVLALVYAFIHRARGDK